MTTSWIKPSAAASMVHGACWGRKQQTPTHMHIGRYTASYMSCFFLRKRVEEDQGLVQPYRHLLWSNFNPMTSASSKKTSTSTGIKSFNHPYSYESKTAPLRQKWPERGTSPTYCLGFLNSDGIDLGLNESKKQTAPQKDGPTANRKFKFFQQKRNWSKVQGRSCYTWNISANTITICQSVLQGHCSCWLKH